ncbi:hypothetical protein PFISCL1PPCAC_15090, partial [Pristionchus fissidentatus]
MASPAATAAATAVPSMVAAPSAGPIGIKKPLNLANKPGEPAFQLKIEPADHVVMNWTKGITSTIDLKVTNSTPDPHSFKVKCTDNNMFRVRPPLGFIEAGQSLTIKVFQTSSEIPEENRHFFAIYHKKSTVDEAKKQPRNVWKPDTKPDGVVRLLAVFKNVPAGPVTPEKKADEKKEEKKDEKKPDEKQ